MQKESTHKRPVLDIGTLLRLSAGRQPRKKEPPPAPEPPLEVKAYQEPIYCRTQTIKIALPMIERPMPRLIIRRQRQLIKEEEEDRKERGGFVRKPALSFQHLQVPSPIIGQKVTRKKSRQTTVCKKKVSFRLNKRHPLSQQKAEDSTNKEKLPKITDASPQKTNLKARAKAPPAPQAPRRIQSPRHVWSPNSDVSNYQMLLGGINRVLEEEFGGANTSARRPIAKKHPTSRSIQLPRLHVVTLEPSKTLSGEIQNVLNALKSGSKNICVHNTKFASGQPKSSLLLWNNMTFYYNSS